MNYSADPVTSLEVSLSSDCVDFDANILEKFAFVIGRIQTRTFRTTPASTSQNCSLGTILNITLNVLKLDILCRFYADTYYSSSIAGLRVTRKFERHYLFYSYLSNITADMLNYLVPVL